MYVWKLETICITLKNDAKSLAFQHKLSNKSKVVSGQT